MKFEDCVEKCPWRHPHPKTVKVENSDGDIVEVTQYFCGPLGIRCAEKTCAPFYFAKHLNNTTMEDIKEILLEE